MADKKNGSQSGKAPDSLTKKGAVRLALKDLGSDAKPLQIQGHIQKKYGVDMDLNHISTCKGEILREGGQAKPVAGKPAPAKALAAPKPAGKPGPGREAASPRRDGTQGISLRDIETIKDLVERVGAPSLKRLIDVMAR
jgi:hypothetical protein